MATESLVCRTKAVFVVVAGSVAAGALWSACNRPQRSDAISAANGGAVTAALSSATSVVASTDVTLQVFTNSCGANQVQNVFQVINNGTTAVPLSSIQIKFWPDDTSGRRVVPEVSYGGCVSNAGNPSCVHQVSGVTAASTSFPSCGSSPAQQANWEITISNSDNTLLLPGATWSNVQSQVHLANFGNFAPGTADWYSSCVSSSNGGYVNTGTFALYQSGQLVRTSTGVPPACRAPTGSQTTTGNVPPAVANAPLVGSLPGTTELSLSISLQLQLNGAPGSGVPPITTFIDQLSNPNLSSRPAPLTPAGFAAAYGPSAADYNNLINFVTANGLTVDRTFTGRNMLMVSGSAAAVESAFFVTLNVYQRDDGTTFFAPANDPSFNPGSFVTSIPIIDISGLDDFAVASSGGGGTSSVTCNQSPIGVQNAFYGSDFVNAYFPGCASLLGQGGKQTIALVELDSYLASDITAFVQGTLLGEPGLSAPSNLGNVVQEVAPSGTQIPFSTVTFPPNGGSGKDNVEVALDMSMVLDVAPQANLIVYERNPNPKGKKPVPFHSLLAQIADEHRAQVISSSWFWQFSTNSEQLAVQNVFYQYACQSQTFFEASMDKGAYIPASPYKSSVPTPLPNVPEPHMDSVYMTVVGGTELTTSAGAYSFETTWNDTSFPREVTRTVNGVSQTTFKNSVTGGGFCTGTSPSAPGVTPLTALPIPSWQVGVNSSNIEVTNNPLNARMIPDVSLVATDFGIVIDGGSFCAIGTSGAAPLWAGFTALINEANGVGSPSSAAPIGFLNPTLYQVASAGTTNFNDIADGSNDDWFDDGQLVEGVNDGAGPPSPPTQKIVSGPPPSVITFTSLPGAPPAGTSEARGLYHAFGGYDLATGLGTPTCGFLAAVAPSLNPTPQPRPVVITYEQIGACTLYADALASGASASSGPGRAYVFFGIRSITNNGSTPFTVQLSNMFVPTVPTASFAALIGSDLEESVYKAGAEPASEVVNAGVTFAVNGVVGISTLPTTSDTTVASFFLNYSLNPFDASATDPQVVFIKSNASTTSFPITGDCGSLIF
jgi:kumamolisin